MDCRLRPIPPFNIGQEAFVPLEQFRFLQRFWKFHCATFAKTLKLRAMNDRSQDPGAGKIVTAGAVIIGDEILSGRTQDVNLNYIAGWLLALGIQLREARVVPDVEARIVDAVNALRVDYDYVFTTGGIGPTHDDITADAIGKAFGVEVDFNPDALAILEAHYPEGEFNESRRRMARTPVGASLIDNPVSKAPGFQIGNVFVLAGIPKINQAMLESLRHRLVGGAKVRSRSVAAALPEGSVAKGLGSIQDAFPAVSIGSYPYYRAQTFGCMLVVRSADAQALDAAFEAVVNLIGELGAEPVVEELT